MPQLKDCDPRALLVVLAECERLVGDARFNDIALSAVDSTKQYGEFMYHAGERALIAKLKHAVKKQQEQTDGLSGS